MAVAVADRTASYVADAAEYWPVRPAALRILASRQAVALQFVAPKNVASRGRGRSLVSEIVFVGVPSMCRAVVIRHSLDGILPLCDGIVSLMPVFRALHPQPSSVFQFVRSPVAIGKDDQINALDA